MKTKGHSKIVYFNSFLAYTKFLLRHNVPTSTLGMETLHFSRTKCFNKLFSFEARSSSFPSTNVQTRKQTWWTKPCSFYIDLSQGKWTIQTSWKFKQVHIEVSQDVESSNVLLHLFSMNPRLIICTSLFKIMI